METNPVHFVHFSHARRINHLIIYILLQPALLGETIREPLVIGAVVVDHVLVLRFPQLLLLPHVVQPPAEPVAGGGGGRWALAAHPGVRARHAAVGGEVPEVGHERRLRPVGLDAAALRRPVVGVPQAAEQPHRLVDRERHAGVQVVLELPDRHVVNQDPDEIDSSIQPYTFDIDSTLTHVVICKCSLQDLVWVPDDGVGVEILGRVEPEPVLHLPAAFAIGEDIGVQGVRLPGDVAQELEVDLVVGVPILLGYQLHQTPHIYHQARQKMHYAWSHAACQCDSVDPVCGCCFMVTYVYRGDGAGGVVGDELDVHVDPCEEVGGLGPERRPHLSVQRQRDGLAAMAVAEQLRLAKQDLELVRHQGAAGHRRGGGGEQQRKSRQAG
uniref:Uncharacterized protein n=1 Tax=Oryza brachyantha TaxID=4533 RepID=J3M149_ORYBR